MPYCLSVMNIIETLPMPGPSNGAEASATEAAPAKPLITETECQAEREMKFARAEEHRRNKLRPPKRSGRGLYFD